MEPNELAIREAITHINSEPWQSRDRAKQRERVVAGLKAMLPMPMFTRLPPVEGGLGK